MFQACFLEHLSRATPISILQSYFWFNILLHREAALLPEGHEFASLACKIGFSRNCASGTCTNGKSGYSSANCLIYFRLRIIVSYGLQLPIHQLIQICRTLYVQFVLFILQGFHQRGCIDFLHCLLDAATGVLHYIFHQLAQDIVRFFATDIFSPRHSANTS